MQHIPPPALAQIASKIVGNIYGSDWDTSATMDSGAYCLYMALIDRRAISALVTTYRVSYMEAGRGQETGVYRDRAKAEQALKRFRSYTKAWLQESGPGSAWRTLDV